jgi:hypothetical protein
VDREERDGLRAYRFASLPAKAIDAIVSTRMGGASAPPYESLNLGLRVGDREGDVLANRERFFTAFGLPLARSVWCRQVHSDGVTVVGEEDAGRGSTSEATIVDETDAMVTGVPDLPLCVTLADCVPVVIVDPRRSVLGLAHAGWGGTVARIASRTVAVMAERFDCEAQDLIAAIGPSIGPSGYEVGRDVIDRAEAAFGSRAGEVLSFDQQGKARFDLWSANRIDLEEAGIPTAGIEVSEISTDRALDEFYSHRVEGTTGRFIAAASLRRR